MSVQQSLALAMQALRNGDLLGAERFIAAALAGAPRDVNALHLMAAVKRTQNSPEAALGFFDRALADAPQAAPIQFNRANLLAEMGRGGDALAGYDAAIALRADHGETWLNRARVLVTLERWDEALQSFDRAEALGQGAATRERGAALIGLERYEEALVCFDARLAKNARDASAAYNLARCLQQLGRLSEALTAYDAALALEPIRADISKNRGVVLYWLGRAEEAVSSLDVAQALAPDDAEIAHTKAVTLLAAGDFPRGWPLHEARRRTSALPMRDEARGEPEWRGEGLDGTLRIWGEQGIGDEVLFARFAPLAAARAKRVVLECAPRLVPVFARAFPGVEVCALGDTPRADAQVALGSLPLALGSVAPDGEPYLVADAEPRAVLRARYENLARGRPIIGIAWMSKARFGAHKSSRLLDWQALLTQDALFVDLQYGEHDAELADARAALGCDIHADESVDQMSDLDAFAAQIAALDRVVTVSNTTAHIAGALGVPCTVLVPPAQGLLWYWGARGERTPWYDSVCLVRRAEGESWADQVARAAQS